MKDLLLSGGESLRRLAQHRQDPGRIVGADQVQGPVEGRGGIVLPNGLHGLGVLLCGPGPQQEFQRRAPEGIVHGAVQLRSQQIFPQGVVADFVGGVLPDLSQQQRVILFRMLGLTDLLDEVVGELVRHVQPPAGSAKPQPFPDHPVLSADQVLVFRVFLLHVGQGVHPPPALVAAGLHGPEPVPAVIGTAAAGIRSRLRVVAEPVEIDAVVAGVAEHAVQQDPDPGGLCLPAQPGKTLLVAEARVDLQIVGGVVLVVAGGQEDGIEVQHADPHGLEIGQLFPDALQGAAEKGPAHHLPLRVLAVKGRVVPVLHHHALCSLPSLRMGGVRLPLQPVGAPVEPLREDLIGHRVSVPVRQRHGLIDRDLPGFRRRRGQSACSAAAVLRLSVVADPLRRPDQEIVPQQAGRLSDRETAAEQSRFRLRHGHERLAGLPQPNKHLRALGHFGLDGQGDLRACGCGAEGRAEPGFAGIVIQVHGYSSKRVRKSPPPAIPPGGGRYGFVQARILR